jgi:hypothetical protein
VTHESLTTEAGAAREIAKRITRLDYGSAERAAEIARLEAMTGGTVLDIYNPRDHLCEPLASKVAVLKAVLRIDEHGKMARPFPPQSFCNQLLWWVLGNIVPAHRSLARKPPRTTLARVAKQASKAAIPVARYEVKPDGTIAVVTGTPESAAPENEWPLDEFRTKEIKK